MKINPGVVIAVQIAANFSMAFALISVMAVLHKEEAEHKATRQKLRRLEYVIEHPTNPPPSWVAPMVRPLSK